MSPAAAWQRGSQDCRPARVWRAGMGRGRTSPVRGADRRQLARIRLIATCVAIAAPLAPAQQPFTEESLVRGVDYITSWTVGAGNGHGVAFADFDNDGDDDLVITGSADGVAGIWENDAGVFVDRSSTAGLPLLPEASGVVAADYDGDGWLDLYFTQSLTSNILMRNIGGFAFEDRSAAAGVSDGAHDSQGACFGDYDGDGWLDLYVCEITGTNPLYRNQGDGTFVEVSAEAGVVEGSEWPSFQAAFWDYDLDGDVDLYLGHDKAWGWPFYRGNRLWRNDGDGTFTDVTEESGISASIGCMGLTVGDINHDQWPDIYMSNTTLDTDPYGNPLFVNNADGTFTQSNVEAGVVAERWGWGVLFWDFDNNGFEDLYVCNTNVAYGANQLFANYGEFPLVNIAGNVDMEDFGNSYTCALSDIEDDGDLDIVVVSVAQPVQLYINHEGEQRNWLKIKLIGDGANRFSVGARIDLHATDLTAQRHVLAGEGFKSSSSYVKHVGLGDAVQADQVTVTWPGGGHVAAIEAIPANQTVVLDEQSCAGSTTWAWTSGTTEPSPDNGAYATAEDAELSWSGVPGAVYTVYFGSSLPPPFVAETTATTHAPGELDADTTYYWRVDMRACVVSVGTTWSFTTPADDPDTPDDPQAPTVIITDPPPQGDLATDTPTITLSGVATYSQEPAAVVWATDQGISGPCVGLIDWNSGPIGLAVGPNMISVRATDRLHNIGCIEVIVTYTPSEPQPDPDSDEPHESEPDEPEETVDQDDPEPDDSSPSDSSGEPDESDAPETGDENPQPPPVDQGPPVSPGIADDTNEADETDSRQAGRVVGSGTCGSLGTVAWSFTLLGLSMLRPRLDRRSR